MEVNPKIFMRVIQKPGYYWWLRRINARTTCKIILTLSPVLTRADEALGSGRAIKLEAGLNKEHFTKRSSPHEIFVDDRDVDLLVDSLSMRLITAGPVDNLGLINKGAFSL